MDPDLLADLAAAPCGSRALDERIALALGWVKVPGKWRAPLFDAPDGHTRDVPAYTTSMDAALTLVPNASKITPRLVLAFCDAALRAGGGA